MARHGFVRALAFFALALVFETSEASETSEVFSPGSCAGVECESQADGALHLLQSRVRKVVAPSAALSALGLHRSTSEDAEALLAAARQKSELVEALFQEVTEAGRYFDPFNTSGRNEDIREFFKAVHSSGMPILSALRPRDQTWEICTNIDWSSVISRIRDDSEGATIESEVIDEMVSDLGLDMCFNNTDVHFKDTTCAAVRATILSALRMSKQFESGPAFANYSVVAWGKHPSWVNKDVSGLDYTKPLPIHATLHNPNAVLGYAVCDILRTVLTISANQQQSSTCSYVAPLAALSHKAPAIVIKMANRALWSGQLTPQLDPPCRKVFEQQPGLVPFLIDKDKDDWIPEFFPGGVTSKCLGNSGDCAVSEGMPMQSPGLTFMWSQSLLSAWLQENLGTCPLDVARAGLAFPGMSAEHGQLVASRAGGGAESMLWVCNKVIDPKGGSCKLVFNTNVCGDVPDEICYKLIESSPDLGSKIQMDDSITRARGKVFAAGLTEQAEMEKAVLDELMSDAKGVPRSYNWLQLISKARNESDDMSLSLLLHTRAPQSPSFTEALLEEVCNAHTAILAIASTPLQLYEAQLAQDLLATDLPFFGNYKDGTGDYSKDSCDHAVYLEKCMPEENIYTLWSWGTTYNVTKQWLLGYPTAVVDQMDGLRSFNTFNTGMVCFGVVADQITVS